MVLPPTVDLTQLESDNADVRKNYVGNTIYELINNSYGPEFAPRLTGMLLDENVLSFKALLTDNNYLNGKVNEAYTLLMTNQNTETH